MASDLRVSGVELGVAVCLRRAARLCGAFGEIGAWYAIGFVADGSLVDVTFVCA